MQTQAGDKIDFQKSDNGTRSWSPQMGEVCIEGIALSMHRAPPAVRGRPAVAPAARPSAAVPARKRSGQDRDVEVVLGALKVAETVLGAKDRFQQWLKSPPPPPKGEVIPVRTVPPFDIQEIPGAMRKLGAPMGAKLMERWFAGGLNYSPTPQHERDGINQDGLPYPPSMIDTTSVKIDWVLKFARAREGLDALMSQLETPRAQGAILNALRLYQGRDEIRPFLTCRGDIVRLHENFQFQKAPVESSLSQQLTQFAMQNLFHEGVPDDLTCALGAFNLYAAISRASFNSNRGSATVTHVAVYVKDNYTFTDDPDRATQYLGHWNRNHVAIVPIQQAAAMANIDWLHYAVVQGDVHAKDAVLYPVKNSDFRVWQQKHNQGGDFILYSDPVFIQLDRPITVSF